MEMCSNAFLQCSDETKKTRLAAMYMYFQLAIRENKPLHN